MNIVFISKRNAILFINAIKIEYQFIIVIYKVIFIKVYLLITIMSIEDPIMEIYKKLSLAGKTFGQDRLVILEDALSIFSDELLSESADNYCHRGGVLLLLERFDEALEDVNEALRIDPNYATAYLGRGRIYNMMEKFDEATIDLKKAIELNPQNTLAYVFLGDSFRGLCNTRESRENYERALQFVENIPIIMWRPVNYAIGIRVQRGSKLLDPPMELDINYEHEAVNRQILIQQQIDNMI